MNHRREFEIAYIGLKDGISQYEYQIDYKFFENLERLIPASNDFEN